MESRLMKPLARSKALVVEELGDELLVYDLNAKTAHCLTPAAARVWRACDGKSRSDAMSAGLGMDSAEVSRALDELERCDLLVTLASKKKAGHTRRDFGLKVTKVAAATATLPLVLSVAAPAVAATVSQEKFCFDITGTGGTNNCNICNQKTGNNTLCCCCHGPTKDYFGVNFDAKGGDSKLCAADAKQCCCQGGAGSGDYGPAHHCTESDDEVTGRQNCSDVVC